MEVLYMSPIGKGQNYPQLCHCATVLDYWSVVSGGPIQQLTVSGAVSIVGWLVKYTFPDLPTAPN